MLKKIVSNSCYDSEINLVENEMLHFQNDFLILSYKKRERIGTAQVGIALKIQKIN